MKIYSWDFGWKGALIVVAESEEQAIQKVLETYANSVLAEAELQVYEITDIVRTIGDH